LILLQDVSRLAGSVMILRFGVAARAPRISAADRDLREEQSHFSPQFDL